MSGGSIELAASERKKPALGFDPRAGTGFASQLSLRKIRANQSRQ